MADDVQDSDAGKLVKSQGGLVIATIAPQDCAAVEKAAADAQAAADKAAAKKAPKADQP